MRDNDDWTLSLITNEEVLAVHKNGRNPKMVYRENDRTVWTSKDEKGTVYVALFNLSEQETEVSVKLEQLGLSNCVKVRNLWLREDVGTVDAVISNTIPPHGSTFFKLTAI